MTQEDILLKENWQTLLLFLKNNLGKKPTDLNGVLFLIGVQELGQGKKVFTKEQKQDLMHIAICKVLSFGGYYELEGVDKEGWPHWKLIKPLPSLDMLSQEVLLKHFVIEYFKREVGLHI
ncbi:hypothetical protein Emtol_1934 [Emticicia oligotrophica DSM 17448]|uniref:DUF2384 domain-containing protein n=1 Tax=Emticicia oligotrophica (strain DSM 17448 / CIP 109782 / MTCC 6937 / GPTSA100-15) TaxID=929562 RepID=A0ABM5N0R8_EMTOG|nr:hypothetical protein [Emticicia oligotrophica]AFK03074.1 hypothetical protein Emtol_1934 [Emticicia oligotrophica DSM 17448]